MDVPGAAWPSVPVPERPGVQPGAGAQLRAGGLQGGRKRDPSRHPGPDGGAGPAAETPPPSKWRQGRPALGPLLSRAAAAWLCPGKGRGAVTRHGAAGRHPGQACPLWAGGSLQVLLTTFAVWLYLRVGFWYCGVPLVVKALVVSV